ncbi:hypothetical protein ACJX0J_034811, partial [Zea mays]
NSIGRQMGSYFNANSNRLGSPIRYLCLNMNAWDNGSLNYPSNPTNMSAFSSPRNGGQVSLPSDNWGGLPSAHGMYNISSLGSGNLGHAYGCNSIYAKHCIYSICIQ